MILIFFVRDLTDCKNINRTIKNTARLAAGRVSKRIIIKLRQYVATDEKSEKVNAKKLINPDRLKSEKSILKEGTSPNKDPASVIEKIIIFLRTKTRSSR